MKSVGRTHDFLDLDLHEGSNGTPREPVTDRVSRLTDRNIETGDVDVDLPELEERFTIILIGVLEDESNIETVVGIGVFRAEVNVEET